MSRIHRYAKVNNKCINYYDKNKESSYLKYCDVNNLFGWAMSQKLPVNKFEWIEDTAQFNEDFLKNYSKESCDGYFLEVDVQYLEKLYELHNGLPFLRERIKTDNFKKLVTNLHDKIECIIHIKNLKQSLKDFFKLMNNADLGKIMENFRKNRNIKLVATERKRNYLVSEPNFHTTKFFTKKLLAIKIRKNSNIHA